MSVSAVLIVKNEAACLGACLDALRGVVDEVVVADTGSTDASRAIALSHGARVVEFPWCGDFSAARNFAISHASHDCVLTVDADESLTSSPEEARLALLSFAADASSQPLLGLVEIINLRADDGGEVAVDQTARVFHRRHFRYVGAIHEQLIPFEVCTPAARLLPLRFRHTGYALTPEQTAAKAHRNIAILRRELEAHPNDEYYRYQLGKAWGSLGRHKAAAIAFEQALRAMDFTANPPRGRLGAVGRPVLTGTLCGAAYALMNSNDEARALALLREHQRLGHAGTNTADFFHALGYACLRAGQLVEAEAAYRLSLGLPEDVQGCGSWSSWYHLGLIDEAGNDVAQARIKYRESLRLRPDYVPALARLAELEGA